eukprot:2022930-Rhodomonas_salina.1
MGRMTNWFERFDTDHPTLLLIEEWLPFAQSLQASPLLTQLRAHVIAVKLAWIPSPIYSGCSVNPASLPCPEAYRSFDLRNVWGSPVMWSRSPVMLYAVVSLAISHGWIIQARATAGLLLSVGPIVNDETFELQLDQPDPYPAVDEASHSDTRTDWISYSKEIESALDLQGVLWFPPKSCSRVHITPHLLEIPETVAPSDAAWTVIPHALWYEGYSLSQATGLVLLRGKCLAITQSLSQGVYLLSQHEQLRREQLGIADAEYVPLAWDERPEAEEGI